MRKACNRLPWRRKLPVSRKLDAQTLDQVLADARLLYGQGVWVRELFPGETVSETPEIGKEPLVTPSSRRLQPVQPEAGQN